MGTLAEITIVIAGLIGNLVMILYGATIVGQIRSLGKRISPKYKYKFRQWLLPFLGVGAFIGILISSTGISDETVIWIYRILMLFLVFICFPVVVLLTRRFVGVYEHGLYVGMKTVKYADIDYITIQRKVITRKHGNIGGLRELTYEEEKCLLEQGVKLGITPLG